MWIPDPTIFIYAHFSMEENSNKSLGSGTGNWKSTLTLDFDDDCDGDVHYGHLERGEAPPLILVVWR